MWLIVNLEASTISFFLRDIFVVAPQRYENQIAKRAEWLRLSFWKYTESVPQLAARLTFSHFVFAMLAFSNISWWIIVFEAFWKAHRKDGSQIHKKMYYEFVLNWHFFISFLLCWLFPISLDELLFLRLFERHIEKIDPKFIRKCTTNSFWTDIFSWKSQSLNEKCCKKTSFHTNLLQGVSANIPAHFTVFPCIDLEWCITFQSRLGLGSYLRCWVQEKISLLSIEPMNDS